MNDIRNSENISHKKSENDVNTDINAINSRVNGNVKNCEIRRIHFKIKTN